MRQHLVSTECHDFEPGHFGIELDRSRAYASKELVDRLRRLTICTVGDLLEVAKQYPRFLAEHLNWTPQQLETAQAELIHKLEELNS